MESKKYKNKEWLRKQLDEGRTLTSIAEDADVDIKTISYWRDKFELDGNKKTELECSNCGKIYERLQVYDSNIHFCSTECESQYKENKVEFYCSNCGDIVKRIPSQVTSENYFCSTKCRTEYQTGKNHPRYSTIEIECDYCSELFERTPSQLAKENNYCSEECYYQSVQTDRDENKHEYKRWRNNVRARDDWTCQNCGYQGERIEAHHIKSWKKNPDKRFNEENGLSLCIECHYLTHRKRGNFHSVGLIKGRVDFDRLEKMREDDITGV